jgi:hypothetical protein
LLPVFAAALFAVQLVARYLGRGFCGARCRTRWPPKEYAREEISR